MNARAIDTILQDVRYGVRWLRRAPGFTVAAVLTLAIGIGANAAVFSVVNGVLLRPLPVERPDELVSVFTSDFSGPVHGASSFVDYQDFRARTGVFAGLMAHTPPRPFTIRGDTHAERLTGSIVTDNYFDVLGLTPAAGRFFAPADDRIGAGPIAVISYGLWQRHFGGGDVIDATLTLDAVSFTVVGVAPRGFTGALAGQTPELWIPMSAARAASILNDTDITSRRSRGLMVTGRLGPGVTSTQAQAALDVLASQLYGAYPEEWSDVTKGPRRITVAPEREARFGSARSTLVNVAGLLLAVVGVVLLLACANVANLLIARASARRREIGTRFALGAGRSRVIRQLLTETLVLVAGAATAGTVIAWWGIAALRSAMTMVPPLSAADIDMDVRVLGFTAAVSLASALFFGIGPALKTSQVNLVTALRDGGAVGRHNRRAGIRGALVGFQIAVSLVLLVVGGLFLRSLFNAQRIDLGFTARNVALLTIETPRQYSPTAGAALHARILEHVSAIPGVESAAFGVFMPVSGRSARAPLAIDGYVPKPGEDMELFFNPVSPGYIETLAVPLARGRTFTSADVAAGRNVMVVNATLAERYWPDQDPVGRRVQIGNSSGPAFEVVGVVRDSKYRTVGEQQAPHFYIPLAGPGYRPRVTLHVRTSQDPRLILPVLRAAIADVDRAVPVFDVRTLEEHVAAALAPTRLGSAVLGLFALLGLLLAAVGLYGVMAYVVAQRTHEIGIRMALGATRGAVLRMMMGDGMRIVALGIAVGVSGALFVTGPVRTLLYGVDGPEIGVIIGSTLLVVAAAGAASYIPTRRLASVNPVEALRVE